MSRIVSVTITGTNDQPVVEATDVTGGVTELVTATGNLTNSGTIAFTDVDLTDVHSISTVTASSGALGSLTASVTNASTGDGAGVVTWNYSVAASAVEYLGATDTKIETFSFNVLDGNGGSVSRIVSVTITGTADGAPALFTAGPDTVNFNLILAASYLAGTQYDALAGADVVTLANTLELASAAGFDSTQTFFGGVGNDTVTGGGLADIIDGGDGNDTLNGNANTDTLSGGTGDDTLNGGDQADTLTGGTGNDLLQGGGANDTYRFGLADGSDTIIDTGGNDDTIVITAGGALAALSFERVDAGGADVDVLVDDLAIQVGSTLISVIDHYPAVGGSANPNLELIQFQSGSTYLGYNLATSYRISQDNSTPLDGTNGEDIIASSSDPAGETLNGANQNDLLFGNGGTDTLNGGSGNDLLIGGAGNDILNGGAGNDVLVGGIGIDTYNLGVGEGSDRVVLTSINDTGNGVGNRDVINNFNTDAPGVGNQGDILDITDLLTGIGQSSGQFLTTLSTNGYVTYSGINSNADTLISFDSNGTAAGGTLTQIELRGVNFTSVTNSITALNDNILT